MTGTLLTLTDDLALFHTAAGGRQVRTWARKGEAVEVEVTGGQMWKVRRQGRDYVAVPRIVIAATK